MSYLKNETDLKARKLNHDLLIHVKTSHVIRFTHILSFENNRNNCKFESNLILELEEGHFVNTHNYPIITIVQLLCISDAEYTFCNLFLYFIYPFFQIFFFIFKFYYFLHVFSIFYCLIEILIS